MIIRENDHSFIMIEQHHHAEISGYLFQQLSERFLLSKYHSLHYAIVNHDCGWIPFDDMPIWNDVKNQPYSFIDFPISFKTVLYRHGINQVQENDPYAALLCSEHYRHFLKNNDLDRAKKFVQQEKLRQEKIIDQLADFNHDDLSLHVSILQFFDSLSLYISLNEPGVAKENEHSYFKNGIPLPASFGAGTLHPNWDINDTIYIDQDLFHDKIHLRYIYKQLSKDTVMQKGIHQAYIDTHYDEQQLTITFKPTLLS